MEGIEKTEGMIQRWTKRRGKMDQTRTDQVEERIAAVRDLLCNQSESVREAYSGGLL